MEENISQQEITNWFDNTYSKRGEFYLRPIKAYYVFIELLKAKRGDKILDVACGLGRLLEAAKEYDCELHGIDISSVAIKKAKTKLPGAFLQVANAEQVPYEDQVFDLITCLGSLERMIDLEKVLAELYRVGTKEAQYCFLVRNANTTSWKYIKKGLGLVNKKGHQGANTLEGWTTFFKQAGFKIEEVWPDQYPIFKKQKLATLGLKKIDYRTPVRTEQMIEKTNEFIFLLKKS